MLNDEQRTLAAVCLWELQETLPDMEGVILGTIGGLVMVGTLPNNDSVQRLTAVSAALLLLSEHVTGMLTQGDAHEVRVQLRYADHLRHVVLRPVGTSALLIGIVKHAEETWHPANVSANMQTAATYLQALLEGGDLPLRRWV